MLKLTLSGMFDTGVSRTATAVGLAWYAVLNSLQVKPPWHIILSIELSASLVSPVCKVNWHNILQTLSDSTIGIPQDTDVVKCESSNRHPCYKRKGFNVHVRTLLLPWQRFVTVKEEVVCHNCILYQISID